MLCCGAAAAGCPPSAAVDRHLPPHATAVAHDGTDRQTPNRYINPAAYYASSVKNLRLALNISNELS